MEVAFIGPGKGEGPPPPPAAKKHVSAHRKLISRVEVPRPVLEMPKLVEPERREEPPEAEDVGVEGGVEGGVAGGVVGGVLGGVVSGTGGGGSMEPSRPSAQRPKNVPAFAIAKDLMGQVTPRMSEVFHDAHRGQDGQSIYKVGRPRRLGLRGDPGQGHRRRRRGNPRRHPLGVAVPAAASAALLPLQPGGPPRVVTAAAPRGDPRQRHTAKARSSAKVREAKRVGVGTGVTRPLGRGPSTEPPPQKTSRPFADLCAFAVCFGFWGYDPAR